VSAREYAEALALIDAGVAGPIQPPDYLLLALAEKQPKAAARYLVRLRDKQAAVERILEWYPVWPLPTCLDMLFFARTHIASLPANLKAELDQVYARLRLYEAVLKVRRRRHASSTRKGPPGC